LVEEKKKIYVAYRYNDTNAGQVLANIGVAHRVAFDLIQEGWIPFIPHADCILGLMFGKKIPLQFYYDFSIEWQKCCEAICIVDDGRELSSGVVRELNLAKESGQEIIWRRIDVDD